MVLEEIRDLQVSKLGFGIDFYAINVCDAGYGHMYMLLLRDPGGLYQKWTRHYSGSHTDSSGPALLCRVVHSSGYVL